MAGQRGNDPPDVSPEGEQPRSRSDSESSTAVAVGGSAADWIRERAAALDLSPEEYLERVVASLRAVEAGDPRKDLATASEFGSLEERVEALDEELDSKVQDVRDRVIQVKREADGKAPAEHDHEDLWKAVETGLERIEALEGTVEEMETRLDRGFENYEEILKYLVDRTDDLSEDATTLRDATSALRNHVRRFQAREERDRLAEALKEEANRKGVTEAQCESCSNMVSVALLTEPSCPVCGSAFAGVTPKQGFFGSAMLDTGSPPALEGGESATEEDLTDLRSDPTGDDSASSESGRDPTAVLDEDGSLVDVEPRDVDESDGSTEQPDE